jgi:hypothetical protein
MLRRTSERAAVAPRIKPRGLPRTASTARGPLIVPDRSVLAFESYARKRGLEKPRIPVTRLDHERDSHAAQHGELVDDRPCWGGLGGLGLGRHARVRVQRRCHGSARDLRGFARRRSRLGRNSMQDARKRMILPVSGGADRHAAWTAATLDLQAIAQRTLARGAPRLANLLMMGAAGPGGFLLGVAGATIPNAFSERHAISFRRDGSHAASAGARHVPACQAPRVAVLPTDAPRRREVGCRLLPR